MIISYQWLLDYLPEPLPLDELTNILTAIGLEVEAVETTEAIRGSLEGLVIGEVHSCQQHPNADKLRITTVDTGSGDLLNIVCGAPNVAAGQKVVVAPVGATVYPIEGEPFKIKKAKIRGEESQGMICAEDEIGLGKGHEGIMVLPPDAVPGTLARTYFAIPEPDQAIHIGLTPNRSDAMSHIGVARDVCAYLSHHRARRFQVQLPESTLPEASTSREIPVSVEAPEACPRYAGITITDIRVAPSPDWLQRRLQAIGVRSINNVVDITNYVLHEFGQPLHAFDADKISGNEVRVRFQEEGTGFLSLDGQERTLLAKDLMICDARGGMCIAGVFGGANSGVTDQTTAIFLESAWFDPVHIRRTSMHHGLRTDAATHFEKGVDIEQVIPALKRAASLICSITGANIASGITDLYPCRLEQKEVRLSYNFINKLSGKTYDPAAVRSILDSLGFGIISETGEELVLKVPSNKTDVSQPADIVEEVLRIDGLDHIRIPEKLNISLLPVQEGDRPLREKLAGQLCGQGFQELVTNSIVNSKYYPERTDLVRMLNSLSSELDVLRPSMLESGLEVIQYNCNRKNQDLLLFEFGNIYQRREDAFYEEPQLALWVTGQVRSAHWDQKADPADLYFLKGIIKNLLLRGGIPQVKMDVREDTFQWLYKNQPLCSVKAVERKVLDSFDIKQDVWFGCIHWPVYLQAESARKLRYMEVPRFPAVQRDLAIVLDKAVSYQQLEEATLSLKLNALKDISLFDVFESEKLGPGKKSYALSYTFQLEDRTLTDGEVEQLMQQLIGNYKSRLQAQIRE